MYEVELLSDMEVVVGSRQAMLGDQDWFDVNDIVGVIAGTTSTPFHIMLVIEYCPVWV